MPKIRTKKGKFTASLKIALPLRSVGTPKKYLVRVKNGISFLSAYRKVLKIVLGTGRWSSISTEMHFELQIETFFWDTQLND